LDRPLGYAADTHKRMFNTEWRMRLRSMGGDVFGITKQDSANRIRRAHVAADTARARHPRPSRA